jgi:putative redox protein
LRVSARRRKGFAHSLTARHHTLVADEPASKGGSDTGATPQELLALSLASCTAVTVEMYADRKGWEVGALEVEVEYEAVEEGGGRRFDVLLKIPADLGEDQLERVKAIAAKCPVHRALVGDVEINDRVELVRGSRSPPRT